MVALARKQLIAHPSNSPRHPHRRYIVEVDEYTVYATRAELVDLAKFGKRREDLEAKVEKEGAKVLARRQEYMKKNPRPDMRERMDAAFDHVFWGTLFLGAGLAGIPFEIASLTRGFHGAMAEVCSACAASAVVLIASLRHIVPLLMHERLTGKKLEIYEKELLDAKVEEAGFCQELLKRARSN
jgi:hypothetical protein